MLAPSDFFDLQGLTHASLFKGCEYVWDALDQIKPYTQKLVEQSGANAGLLSGYGEVIPATVVIHQGVLYEREFELLGGDPTKGKMLVSIKGQIVSDAAVVHAGACIMDSDIHFAPGCKIEPGALIKGPSFIGPGSEVRQGAYLRGGCLIGAACVVGHTTEVKNSVMLDEAKAGHFAYLGDSILGRDVNLGAGTKLANLKIIEAPYKIRVGAGYPYPEAPKVRGHHGGSGPDRVQLGHQPRYPFG
jgi:bifunctional N-acetylglucosamine-1-phosphate-uridyltransferase/glucosamine-1-phosphate-acetyltransferase GlmU-like protein